MSGHVVVCLPTFQEADNVERMLAALAVVLDGHGEVLVVDDGSPDGTADLAEAHAERHGGVRVLRRPRKEGLGRAYVVGFRAALDLGADLVVQMDCDFSHAPRDVPRLVAAAIEGADLVLGSRWTTGGGVVGWPRRRLLMSRAGSLYARGLLGVDVRDLTGGFKCWRRAALAALDLDRVRSGGYGFQIETTYRALSAGQRVVEVPIEFVDRERGRSKMTAAIAFEALHTVPALRLQEIRDR